MTIAIDFGTSNTVIARWNPAVDGVEILELPDIGAMAMDHPPLIPSLVYVEDAREDRVTIGQQVRDRGWDVRSDPRFFRAFKRGIGVGVKGFLPEIDGVTIDFGKAGELFLQGVIASLQAQLPEVGDSLVLTVPVDSFEAYRQWLSGVAQRLPVKEIRLLDEPTAAALGYEAATAGNILVIDFGGGTLDLSLVQLARGVRQGTPVGFLLKWGKQDLTASSQKPQLARVIAKAGRDLGGTDLDLWIVEYFHRQLGIAENTLVTRLAERLKIRLSSQPTATEVYFDDEELESYELSLSRSDFEGILRDNGLFDRLNDCLQKVLDRARQNEIEIADIDAVLIVGGSGQIPAVLNWVKERFPEEKIRQSQAFDAIARGALQVMRGTEVSDFLYHSYGIRYWDRRLNRHSWHPIIKTGQPYPMQTPVEIFLGASRENQPSIELIIGELGEDVGSTEVFFDGERLISRQISSGDRPVTPLNDRDGARNIANLNPPGFPGADRVKVSFRVDGDRQLRIGVLDLLTYETILDDKIVAKLS
jgi:molecular chaperone DnaK (HSP70)